MKHRSGRFTTALHLRLWRHPLFTCFNSHAFVLRVRIMHMHLDMPRGEWRDFTAAELMELHRLVDESKKTFDGRD